jgi:large subunit ribosomal protein L30e
MSLVELRKALKEKKLKMGIEETEKLLKQNKVKEVFVASNCPEDREAKIKRHCEISGCKFSKLKEDSRDLGAVCKKPFSISVCCYLK